jgi:DNA invertase Pin-like site-specific DNA recombinase
VTAVGYARISLDGDGRGLGVDRQRQDIEHLADVLRLPLAEVIIENDPPTGDGKASKASASVYSTKPRTKYEALIERVRAGEVTHVLSYSTSRLTRDMIEREHLLALRHAGASITTAQGQRIYPGMSSSEVDMIRMLGVQDTGYSDRISQDTKKAFDQNATNGTPHGPIAYGWSRARERGGPPVDTIDEAQAAVIREAAKRLLAGETMRGVVLDLNERQVPSPRGGRWSTTTLGKLLKRERNAARRVHRGVVVGRAAWQPILDDDTFDALVALLSDPERRPGTVGAAPRALLSGLITCGRCSDTRVWIKRTGGSGQKSVPGYACKTCNGIRRKAEPVDLYVERAICARLAKPDALDWLADDQQVLVEARATLAGLEARAQQIADAGISGAWSVEQVSRANVTLLPQIEAAKAAVERARPVSAAVRSMSGFDTVEAALEAWAMKPLDVQRSIVRDLVTVTLLPTTKRKFDPEGVRLEFRTTLTEKAKRRPPVAV